jgi:hypothetical protein
VKVAAVIRTMMEGVRIMRYRGAPKWVEDRAALAADWAFGQPSGGYFYDDEGPFLARWVTDRGVCHIYLYEAE